MLRTEYKLRGYRPPYCRKFGCNYDLEWSTYGRGGYVCLDCGHRVMFNRYRALVSRWDRTVHNSLLRRDAIQPTGATKEVYFKMYPEQRKYNFSERANV